MLNVIVEVPVDRFDDWGRQFAEAPALMATFWQQNMIKVTAQATLPQLRITPGAPPPGITRLMTPRQRRAFWATDGFGGGIPHQRTNAVPQGWQQEVEASAQGGLASVFNNVPATYWAEWYGQQPFLKAVGWLFAPPILERWTEIGVEVTEETWMLVNSTLEGLS